MTPCIVCEKLNCETIHTSEEIREKEFKGCYVCRQPVCANQHSLEEIKNPVPPTKREYKDYLRILIAYSKLLNNGDDQVSTE